MDNSLGKAGDPNTRGSDVIRCAADEARPAFRPWRREHRLSPVHRPNDQRLCVQARLRARGSARDRCSRYRSKACLAYHQRCIHQPRTPPRAPRHRTEGTETPRRSLAPRPRASWPPARPLVARAQPGRGPDRKRQPDARLVLTGQASVVRLLRRQSSLIVVQRLRLPCRQPNFAAVHFALISRRKQGPSERTMLSTEDNERTTRTGPGTPVGKLLRQYWQPSRHSLCSSRES